MRCFCVSWVLLDPFIAYDAGILPRRGLLNPVTQSTLTLSLGGNVAPLVVTHKAQNAAAS